MPEKLNGKWIKGKKLGEGAFAKVYLCSDATTKQEVAIKQIDKQRLQEEDMGDQMKREIALQKILKHENCVQLYDVFENAKHIYLVLELVRGGELFDKIVNEPEGLFDEPTGRRYFQQLICGLYYCHTQGVAHRDLKPENLLLDDKDNLKITDFGLSNFQEMAAGGDHKMLTTVCGTPNYMAPEVLDDAGYCGFKADIWTAGVILYVMCAGAMPFDDEAEDMNRLFRLIQRCEYHMPTHFSPELRDLIKRILVADTAARLTMDQIIKHKWFQTGGFDMSLIECFRHMSKIEVTDEQVQNAVKKSAKSEGERERTGGQPKPLNAFQIMEDLTGGALTSLIKDKWEEQNGSLRPPLTRFFLRGDHATVLQHCTSTLQALKAKKQDKSTDWELRMSAGPLQFFIFLQPTVAPKLMMVYIRKAKGDTVKFLTFYKKIVDKLGDAVVSKQLSLTSPTNAPLKAGK